MKNKKVMVIGGAGFIGSHLVDALVKEEANVMVIDNLFLGKKENINPKAKFLYLNACTFEIMSETIHQFQPDIVYNLAVMPLPHSLTQPYKNVSENIKIVQNLCEIMRAGVCGKLIQFSSSEVYGSAEYEPMCENHPWKASTPYAASKAAGDMICLSYVRTFDCNISIIRPFNNYGPRQNAGSYAGIIPLTIHRVLKGEPLIIYGDGEQTRDYIYVEDTARAAVMMGNREDLKGQVINIASGHDYTINWLVREIRESMSFQLIGNGFSSRVNPLRSAIIHQPARLGDVRRHIANVLKAKDVLGFVHSINMIDGLEKTIEWYLKNENK